MITDYLYLWLKNELETNLANIEKVMIDYDQDEGGDKENQLIKAPAILVNFDEDADTTDMADYAQEGEQLVELRLITKNLRNGKDRIHKANKVNHFAVAREVFRHLQRVKSAKLSEVPEFAALVDTDQDFVLIDGISRVSYSFDHHFSEYIRSSQTFRVKFRDCTATTEWQEATADLEINNLCVLPME